MGLDIGVDPQKVIATHSRAISLNPFLHLAAGVDQEQWRRKVFSAEYHAPAFTNISSMFDNAQPDLVAVGTPTITHLKVFDELIQHGKPKFVLMEKPLGRNLTEAKEILEISKDAGVPFLVNYL